MVDEAIIIGPFVTYNTKTDLVTQQYIAFVSTPNASETWTGPRDCSNDDADNDHKYSCVGVFLGWVTYEDAPDAQAWMIYRTKVKPTL